MRGVQALRTVLARTRWLRVLLPLVGIALAIASLLARGFEHSTDAADAVAIQDTMQGGGAMIALVVPALVILCALGFVAELELAELRARDLMPLVVFTALAVAGRALLAPFSGVQPVTSLVILAGIVFGPWMGFMTGALSALLSNLLLGQGPWTVWQLYAWGSIGYVAALIERVGGFRYRAFVYLYAIVVSLLFGLMMDSYVVLTFVQPLHWATVVATFAAGLPHNIAHAVSTLLFLLLLHESWRTRLTRFALVNGLEPPGMPRHMMPD